MHLDEFITDRAPVLLAAFADATRRNVREAPVEDGFKMDREEEDWWGEVWAYLAIPLAGFCVQCWAYGRFLRRPSERTARLRPYAELFALCVIVAQVVGFGWPS